MVTDTPISVEDVEYLQRDGAALVGRMYVPVGVGPFPTVINVHGGTWVGGSRLSNEPTSLLLAAAGMIVFAPEFRMPPAVRYPEPVADINAAIRWFKGVAPDHGGTARVAGIGFSSGGHQLMLAAMRPDDPRYRSAPIAGNDHDASLSAVVLCYAVLDPPTRYEMAERVGREDLVRGHVAYWPHERAASEGSPQRILADGEVVTLPPVLVIQGDNDGNLTPQMAVDFVAAYRSARGSAEIVRYPDAEHGFIRKNPDSAAARDANRRIVEFLRAYAAVDPAPRP